MKMFWFLLGIAISFYCCRVNRYIAPASLNVNAIDSLVADIDSKKGLFETERYGASSSGYRFVTKFLKDSLNRLYRVRYLSSADTGEQTGYYYDHGKLVFAEFRLVDRTNDRKIIYNCFYYFRNDSLLAAVDEDTTLSNSSWVLKIGNVIYKKTETRPPKRKT